MCCWIYLWASQCCQWNTSTWQLYTYNISPSVLLPVVKTLCPSHSPPCCSIWWSVVFQPSEIDPWSKFPSSSFKILELQDFRLLFTIAMFLFLAAMLLCNAPSHIMDHCCLLFPGWIVRYTCHFCLFKNFWLQERQRTWLRNTAENI